MHLLTSNDSSNGLLDVDILKLFLWNGVPQLEGSSIPVADPDALPPAHHVAHLSILTLAHLQGTLNNKNKIITLPFN